MRWKRLIHGKETFLGCDPDIAMSDPITLPSPAPARWFYLDHLRAVLVILVVVLHAAVTYSGLGGWYYKEPAELLFPEFLGFAWLESHLQAFRR